MICSVCKGKVNSARERLLKGLCQFYCKNQLKVVDGGQTLLLPFQKENKHKNEIVGLIQGHPARSSCLLKMRAKFWVRLHLSILYLNPPTDGSELLLTLTYWGFFFFWTGGSTTPPGSDL